MDNGQALSQAELYIHQNQMSQARLILAEILRANPQSEEAWILSAQVSEKPEQVIYCLRQAVKINPAASRARLLLERLQIPQSSSAPLPSSQPASQSLPDTQPHQAIHPAVAGPDKDTYASWNTSYSESAGNFSGDTALLPAAAPQLATGPAARLAAQGTPPKRPTRWPQRIFTLAASACLLAPWIFDGNTSRTLTGIQLMLGSIFSPLGVNVGIASLAFLASLVLPLLMLFRFQSAATQKWAERVTIALAPLAAVLCLDMISFYFAGLTSNVELRWGIWASFAFYTLAGLAALINARRLGKVRRVELFAAWPGLVFTWLFSLADILAILVTLAGLALISKFNLIGIAIPSTWLFLGALLGLIA
jgi:hypothetical protein